MTIALVANSTWNIYNFRLNVIDKLCAEGHKVIVIAPVDEYIEYKENYPQVQHISLRTLGRKSMNPLRDVFLILELVRKYRKLKPDLVLHYTHKPNIFGSIAARITKVPSVAMVTGLGFAFLHKGWVKRITVGLYRLIGTIPKEFIFENIDDRILFHKLGIIGAEKGKSIKGCGLDLEYYAPSLESNENQQVIFTFIGRLLYDKGILEFVKAAEIIKSKYPEVRFWVIGELDKDNPSMVNYEDLLKWIEKDIIDYHGFLRDVRPMISQSDCIVLPSYSEGMPRTILEAAAMAKPAIATDVPGCREVIVDGKNGFLVQVKNVASLVQAIEKIIDLSPEARKKMGQEGRRMAEEEFDEKKIASDIYNIIKVYLDEDAKA